MNSRVAIFLLAALLFPAGISMAVPPPGTPLPPPRDYRAEADVVVVGRVKEVLVDRRQYPVRTVGLFRARIEVQDVEKGDLGDCSEVAADYFATVEGQSLGGCEPGDYYPLPEQGDVVRAYLQKTPKEAFAVVPYSGFVIVEASERWEPTDWAAVATTVFNPDPVDERDLRMAGRTSSPADGDHNSYATAIILSVMAGASIASLCWWASGFFGPSGQEQTASTQSQPQDRS